MKNVILVGDSWLAGELKDWSGDDDVLHRGVGQYFTDNNYNVINLCNPGGSNLQSVKRLSDFLLSNNVDKDTCILFWTTEFFREIWHYTNHNNKSFDVSLKDEFAMGYIELKNQWVYRPYYRLQELAAKYSINIGIIGGCSDAVMYDDFNLDFPNLNVLCQSVTNLIINNSHQIQDPVFCEYIADWVDPFLNEIKANSSDLDLSELLTDIKKGQHRLLQFKENKKWFYPDGHHPNRTAHKKLFDFIFEKI